MVGAGTVKDIDNSGNRFDLYMSIKGHTIQCDFATNLETPEGIKLKDKLSLLRIGNTVNFKGKFTGSTLGDSPWIWIIDECVPL